ncbi:DUF3606 domain-containing protein [Acidovorax sp.]|uniref:DUF3606 domain-containing protein n=1 Tax=Acidovorax sp. TaxID=1872122 RepID=UPI003D01AC14
MPRRQTIALADPHPIISTQESGLAEWMQSLDCSEANLLEAMSAVGNSAQAVRNYLHGGKGPWQWVAAAA